MTYVAPVASALDCCHSFELPDFANFVGLKLSMLRAVGHTIQAPNYSGLQGSAF